MKKVYWVAIGVLATAGVGVWASHLAGLFPKNVWFLNSPILIGIVGGLLIILSIVTTVKGMKEEKPNETAPPASRREFQAENIGPGAVVNLGDNSPTTINNNSPSLEAEIGVEKYLERAISMSDQRRKQRFQALGIKDSLLEKLSKKIEEIHRPHTFDKGESQIHFIIGDVGAGKTEYVEEIFRRSVIKAKTGENHPIPIWLSIYDVGPGPLEKIIKDIISLKTLKTRGALIVIDGLDEQLSVAPQILERVGAFTAAWTNSYVVSTSRPSDLLPEGNSITIPALHRDQAIELIQMVSGVTGDLDRSWSEELRELVQRPLFALIAAQHLHELGPGISAAQLLDVVIQDSLKGARSGLTTSLLERLAVEISRAGKPVDMREHFSVEEVSTLKSSPLLNIRGFVARFTLVSFQQWLGAQAIISGSVKPQEFSQQIEKFDQWRYSVAIAISSAQSRKVDEILQVLAREKPGAAAWVIDEVERTKSTTYPLDPLASDVESDDDLTTRFVIALESLLTGLGPTSAAFNMFANHDGKGALEDLGLHVKRVQENLVLLTIVEGGDDDTARRDLPEIISEEGIRGIRTSTKEIENNCWSWHLALENIQDRFSTHLESFILNNLPPNSVCAAEIYRHFFSYGEIEIFSSEKRGEIRSAIQKETLDFNLLDPTGEMNEESLLRLLSMMEEAESTAAKWPAVNFDFASYGKGPEVNFPWVEFRQRVESILVGSLDAYQQLTDELFPNLSDSLRTRVILPAKFEGTVTIRPPSRFAFWSESWLTYWLRPGVRSNSAQISTIRGEKGTLLSQWEENAEFYFQWLKNHPEARMAAGFQMSSGRTDFLGPCPASVIAFDLLWRDLIQAGFLKKGSRPELKEFSR